MSRSVLTAVDLLHREESAAVLKRAAQIAGLDAAALSVVTVVPDFGTSFVSTFFDDDAMSEALAQTQVALHEFVAETLPDHNAVRHMVSAGTVYDEILKAAETIEADMIVMGAAKPGLATRLLGPNAARVARHFDGSVLIVR